MRRITLAALLISVLLLAGCGGGDEAKVTALRGAVQSGTVTALAQVHVLAADTAETYTIAAQETADGWELAVTAPELLSGVTAHIAAGETTLEYDGLILPAPLDDPRRAPLAALPELVSAIRDAHLDLVWQEAEGLCAQFVVTDDAAMRLYLDADGNPVCAETILDGSAVLRCEIKEWSIRSNEPNNSDVGGDQSQHPGA